MKYKPDGTIVCEDSDVNGSYLYIDSDVYTILDLRLRQEQLPNIVYLPPIGSAEKRLKRELKKELVDHQAKPNRTLVIPYLRGNPTSGHWIGLVIRFENNKALKIEYYDSIGGQINEKLKAILKSIYGQDINIETIQDCIKQGDVTSCGPCTIENLINAAKNNHVNKPSSIEIRKNHINLMEEWEPTQLFYIRQKFNVGFKKLESSVDEATQSMGKLSTEDKKTSSDVKKETKSEVVRSNAIYFPRCEYKVRFSGTSAFDMSDRKYWGSYFRSTSRGGNADRLAYKSSKSYSSKLVNPYSTVAKSGTFYSPFRHEDYKKMFHTNPKTPQNKLSPAVLYNLVLEYKQVACHRLVKELDNKIKTQKLELKLEAYNVNNYPCIMIYIADIAGFSGETETPSFYQIVMSYFIAIANQKAWERDVPIELTVRSSFGHNIPTIAVTGKSFRINIGIVPKVYIEVLVDSLIDLNDKFLVPFLNGNLKLSMDETTLKSINYDVKNYNEQKQHKSETKKERKRETKPRGVDTWQKGDSLYSVLRKRGDSSGKKVVFQLVRQNEYVDLLADYVSEELDNKSPNMSVPLNKLLKKLSYDDKVQVKVDKNDYKSTPYSFEKDKDYKENEKIQRDIGFWRILNDISQALKLLDDSNLQKLVNKRQLLGLYRALEEENLEFIRNSASQKAEQGYGSDSDCEVNDDQTFYSRKVTVATGMRAINLVQFLATYRMMQLGYNYETLTEHMYYETGEAVENVASIFKSLSLAPPEAENSAKIRYIDLTHCVSAGKKEVKLAEIFDKIKENDIVILDYTSATTSLIRWAVLECLERISVVILLSSGLKNEQLGADMNPYGTIRIVTRDDSVLNELYLILKNILIQGNEELPKELHQVRKSYKSVGSVVTNQAIYQGKCRYRKPTRDEVYYSEEALFQPMLSTEELRYMVQYLINDNYRDAIHKLLTSNLQGVILNLSQSEELDRLTELDIEFLCEFTLVTNVNDQINQMSFANLKRLCDLINSYRNELERLAGIYHERIEEIIYWNNEKLETLGSAKVLAIVQDECNETSFDEILECYDSDSEITECIINGEKELPDNFQNIFGKLQYAKKRHEKQYRKAMEYGEYIEDFDCSEELDNICTEEERSYAYCEVEDDEENEHNNFSEEECVSEDTTDLEEDQNISDSISEGADNEYDAYYLTSVCYDNPILNNKNLLKSAYNFGGANFLDKLINIGSDLKFRAFALLLINIYEKCGIESVNTRLSKFYETQCNLDHITYSKKISFTEKLEMSREPLTEDEEMHLAVLMTTNEHKMNQAATVIQTRWREYVATKKIYAYSVCS